METLFPIQDSGSIEHVKTILSIYLGDNVKARRMNSEGTYSGWRMRDKV